LIDESLVEVENLDPLSTHNADKDFQDEPFSVMSHFPVFEQEIQPIC